MTARTYPSRISKGGADLALARSLNRIEDPSARKIVIMSKWERGELTNEGAERLIRGGGLASA